VLSSATVPLYLAARRAAGGEPEPDRPLLWNDFDGFIQPKVEGILRSLAPQAALIDAIEPVKASLVRFMA
jgi:phenylalanine ammonia-lyase